MLHYVLSDVHKIVGQFVLTARPKNQVGPSGELVHPCELHIRPRNGRLWFLLEERSRFCHLFRVRQRELRQRALREHFYTPR